MAISQSARADLASSFEGELIGPDHEGYDRARRVDNAGVDRKPALIAKPLHAADVATAVQWAGRTNTPLSVAGGRHGFSGDAVNDGGLVIDLSHLKDIRIDVEARTASVGGGVTAGELTTAAYESGFAVPFGDTGSVGIGGLTLGGGLGWLVRRYGATVDQLRSIEIVTADGVIRTTSAALDPDLFWALRGGGGNFGVVTAFEFELNPIGPVTHGSIILPATREVVRALVPLGLAAPDELTIMPLVMRMPPMPDVPEALHGTLSVFIELLFSGAEEDADRALAPFRALAPVILDTVARKPYPEVDLVGWDGPWSVVTDALFIDDLDDEIAEIVMRRLGTGSPAEALVQLRVLGGAFARSADGSTALGHRGRPALLWLLTPFQDLENAAAYRAWTRSFRDELASKSRGTYLNFLEAPDAESVAAAYAPEALARLGRVKRTYDPDNRFRPAANIQPGPRE